VNPQPELFTSAVGLGGYREVVSQTLTPFGVAMRISQNVANVKWTPQQQQAVDAAIAVVARAKSRFTADDVWAQLGTDFPVTKGLAGRLNAAVRRGVIRNTGEVAHAKRGGAHDHAQRLTVWAFVGGTNGV
jgi:hypothetical protein